MEIHMSSTSTIAAIATGLSDSGIGIVRISGPDAIKVGDRIFCSPAGKSVVRHLESHKLQYGCAVKEDRTVIDEAMAVVMKAPKSYTGEDTVEIQCHGGVLVMKKILETALKCGARLAEPGEFTKRAFLNGKKDLSEAEAVMDVIRSKNDYALISSARQLRGELGNTVRQIRKELLQEIAAIEAALDDPEHLSLEGYPEKLRVKLEEIRDKTEKLVDSAVQGRFMKEGISTVIVGKPNVGKSSLLNLLSGEDRAIVTDIAGTTRDILEENVNLHGISLNVIDTAGIRDAQDQIEQIGVEKARQYAGEADLILYVADSSLPLDENDREIFSLIKEKKIIVLLNKSDLKERISEEDIRLLAKPYLPGEGSFPVIRVSAKEKVGMEELENAIRDLFFQGDFFSHEQIVITNLRHREALQNACESVKLVLKSIENGMEEDFYSIDLMDAYRELGKITGEEVDDDVVEEIFSKFCMGK